MGFRRQDQVHELLIQYLDSGLTAKEIGDILGIDSKQARQICESLYPVYIDRWIVGRHDKYEAVYCISPPPEDCPKPEAVVHESNIGGRYIFKRTMVA